MPASPRPGHGLPVKPVQSALSVDVQETDPNSILKFLSRHSGLAQKPILPSSQADITFFKCDEPVLAYRRSAGNKDLICVFNLSAEPRTVKLSKVELALEPVSPQCRTGRCGAQPGPEWLLQFLPAPAGEGKVSYKAR